MLIFTANENNCLPGELSFRHTSVGCRKCVSRFLNVTDVDKDGVEVKRSLNFERERKKNPENQTVNWALQSTLRSRSSFLSV